MRIQEATPLESAGSSIISRGKQMKEHPITPLMPISLILTLAIITAQYSYDYLNTHLWLIATFLSWGMGCLFYILGNRFRYTKRQHAYKGLGSAEYLRSAKDYDLKPLNGAFHNNIFHQCLILYICIFSFGGLVTSHRIDQAYAPAKIETCQDLSPIDHTILAAQSFRNHLEQEMLSLHIEAQDYAVISAMALGDKSALDAETKESYSVAGTSHVLAVSGLHIAIIFQVILLVLGGKRKARLTIAISTTAVWAYVILIGLPASAVRSATMISLYSFGLMAKRQGASLNILAFAYVIMLCFYPLSLFDLSFQMSFLAVASILLFHPLIVGLYEPQHACTRWAWQLMSVSLAAQLGTIPIIMYYFGRISCYSVLTSFVAIPMATLVLYLCALLFGLFLLSYLPFLSAVSLYAVHLVARCLVSITQLGNTIFRLVTLLPGASIEGIHLSLVQVFLLYLILCCTYIFWYKIARHNSHLSKIK